MFWSARWAAARTRNAHEICTLRPVARPKPRARPTPPIRQRIRASSAGGGASIQQVRVVRRRRRVDSTGARRPRAAARRFNRSASSAGGGGVLAQLRAAGADALFSRARCRAVQLGPGRVDGHARWGTSTAVHIRTRGRAHGRTVRAAPRSKAQSRKTKTGRHESCARRLGPTRGKR